MEKQIRALNLIKGMLLLSEKGDLYVLKDYEIVEDEIVKQGWIPFQTQKKVTYVSKLVFDQHQESMEYSFKDLNQCTRVVNETISDRNRYLRMARNLNSYGCTIKRK